eukprot:TRINITY_DN1576_c0_g2_i1.p1 TRINITY_DN1576_c0_g2~~TRINITY_DN1576_c0_g2_i1.p1  ORF type:complete len:158 (-),score=27.31 TRINITY_DN1576_c0_g2_i1:214-687(-)
MAATDPMETLRAQLALLELNEPGREADKKKAIEKLCDATEGSDKVKIGVMVENGVFNYFKVFMSTPGVPADLLLKILGAIERILEVGKKLSEEKGLDGNFYGELMEASGCLDYLELLQSHESIAVYDQVVNILNKYFSMEDEDFQINLADPSSYRSF